MIPQTLRSLHPVSSPLTPQAGAGAAFEGSLQGAARTLAVARSSARSRSAAVSLLAIKVSRAGSRDDKRQEWLAFDMRGNCCRWAQLSLLQSSSLCSVSAAAREPRKGICSGAVVNDM